MEKEASRSIIEVNEVAYLRDMLGELFTKESAKTKIVANLDDLGPTNRFLVGSTTFPKEGTAIISIKEVSNGEEIQHYEISVGQHKYSVFSQTIIEHDCEDPPTLATIEYLKSRTIPGFVIWKELLTATYAGASTEAPRTYLK